MTKMFKILGLTILGIFILSTQSLAKKVRNDMPSVCKYEAKRNFGVSKKSIRTHAVERENSRFVIYGQTPKNTNRALYFKCTFDRRGEYVGIRKTKDTRYASGGQANSHIPKTVKRVCKGEASARWRMRPYDIRIDRTKRVGRNDYVVNLSGRNYRGKCEVSRSGHIYRFRTKYGNNRVDNNIPRAAKHACKRQASARWGARPDNIRINHARRVGRDDYIVNLSARYDRAECEVSGNGHIYLFSEY